MQNFVCNKMHAMFLLNFVFFRCGDGDGVEKLGAFSLNIYVHRHVYQR